MGGFVRPIVVLLLLAASLAAQTASVEGVVVNQATGQPQSDVHVRVLTGDVATVTVERVYGAMSDRAGHFSISGMKPGLYLVVPERIGFVFVRPPGLIPATVLALKAGQHITDQKVEMMPCGFVSGRVVDDTGDPVPGSALQLRAAPPDTDFVNPFAVPLPNFTDDHGEFRIVVSPGKYYLQAMPRSYRPPMEIRPGAGPAAPYTFTYYPNAATLGEASPIEVKPGQDVTSLEIRLAHARPSAPGGGAVASLTIGGLVPSAQMVRAIVNLIAITIEKARALEDASHAEAARQSEVLKSALLDSLAHDIKTPLTSIKAAVTSLLGSAPGADRELLTIINEEADRLNRLAAEVIAMARVEAGKLHLEKFPVTAAELLESALADLAGLRRGRPVTILVAPGLPRVECDPELVQQVAKQLIENAFKYSPEGSPLTVSAVRKGEKIVIGVADRGAGIDEDERARIFDKFFRGRRYRFETKGTGMGLAIAKGIVEAHGEKIWVESEPAQGSAFYPDFLTVRFHNPLS